MNSIDKYDCTPLHWAVNIPGAYGHKEIAKLLLKAGADVNSIDKNGLTPLHSAAQKGLKDTVEVLLQAGAYINAKSKSGKTPLDVAEKWGAMASFGFGNADPLETIELLKTFGWAMNTNPN